MICGYFICSDYHRKLLVNKLTNNRTSSKFGYASNVQFSYGSAMEGQSHKALFSSA